MSHVSRILRITGLLLLLSVLLVGPFFRGLFFWEEQLIAIAAIMAGCALWAAGRRLGNLPLGLPGGPVGWALLALLITYLWQMPWAVYTRGNIDWVLRVATALLAFAMVRAEAGRATRRWVGWSLLAGSFAVSLTGLLEITGYFAKNPDLAASLALVGLSDRIFTVYQYPNAAAAVFMALIMVAAGLCLEHERPWWSALAGASSGVIALAFFYTLSRGAVVVLPFGLLLLLIGLGRRALHGLLLMGALLAAPILVSMNGVAAVLPQHNWQGAIRWIALAALAGAVGAALLTALFRLRPRTQALALGALLVLVAAGFLALRPAGPLVPKAARRLLDMNFKTVNVVLRLHYDQVALKAIADRPLGRGGWGWARSYRQFQPYDFFARETHDHYAQTGVEAGIPGAIALVAFFGLALWTGFRGRRGDPLRWAMAAAAGSIAIHAAIDFDLSFLTIFLLVTVLFAAAADPPEGEPHPYAWAGAAAGALALAGFAAWLAVGSHLLQGAKQLQEQNHTEAAAAIAARSSRYDPWNSEPLAIMGGVDDLQKAVRLDGHNAGLLRQLSIQLELQRDFNGALEMARRALAAQPSVTDHYESYARLAGQRIQSGLANGELEMVRQLAPEVAGVARQLAARIPDSERLQHYWTQGAKLQFNNLLYLHLAKGLYLTGDVKTAEAYFKLASREWQFASEAEVWLYAMYELQGRTSDLIPLEKKPWVRFRNANGTYKALLTWKP